MSSMVPRGRRVAAALLLLAPGALAAQLPPAAQLMAAHIKAIGGEAAVAAWQVVHITATITAPGLPSGGTMELWSARPNRMVSVWTTPGMGETRQGFNGEIAWSVDPMRGARVLEGDELARTRDEAMFEYVFDMYGPGSYKSAETVERTTLGGQECHKVKLVLLSGRETFPCYGVADGLVVAVMEAGPGGESVYLLQNYTDFGGVKVATRTVVQMAGQEQVITIGRLEMETPDPARFELPAEVKALLKK